MSKSENPYNHILAFPNQCLWLLLAFHAGYLNAGGYLSSHQMISHTTGTGTMIGLSVGLKEYWIAVELALVPISFLAGAFLAGYLMDRKLITDRQPRVINGVIIIIFLNIMVFLGGFSGFFGEFGEPLLLQRDFALLFTLCFACGLQNGLFVTVTSGQIRTTHMTGLTTDVGLNFAKIITLKNKDGKRSVEVRRNNLRIKTIVAFTMGSFISALVFIKIHYYGFLVSTGISVLILLNCLWISSGRSKVSTPTVAG
jgi:uncharacterized membrane protein YoaK (UPF0700 family)